MISTTSRSRTSPTLRCTRCSGRSETRSQGRSQPWRIATLHGSSTGRCSSTEGSPSLSRPPRRSYSRPSPPKRPAPEASRLGRSRRRLVRSSIDTAPCIQTSRLNVEVRDDISELMVSFGRLLIPEAAAFTGGPRRALAASRGRHPCRHLPERRQATTDAADDRTAWLRRDPRGPRRARRVPDRRFGPAAPSRARGAGSSHRQDARRRRIPGDLRIVTGRTSDPGEDRLVHRHPRRRRQAVP